MAATDTSAVLEALRTFPVSNGRMTLQYEVPQPTYKTTLGRTYRDPRGKEKTEEGIIGYSVYRDKNAAGPYSRVVAHKDQSHVMHIIAVKGETKMTDEIEVAMNKGFTVSELMDAGGTERMVSNLMLAYLHKPAGDWLEDSFHSYLEKQSKLIESWLPLLTVTPYLSKFHAHEMCTLGKHKTIEQAVQAQDKLSSTFFF